MTYTVNESLYPHLIFVLQPESLIQKSWSMFESYKAAPVHNTPTIWLDTCWSHCCWLPLHPRVASKRRWQSSYNIILGRWNKPTDLAQLHGFYVEKKERKRGKKSKREMVRRDKVRKKWHISSYKEVLKNACIHTHTLVSMFYGDIIDVMLFIL